jgi:hypothetical protein
MTRRNNPKREVLDKVSRLAPTQQTEEYEKEYSFNITRVLKIVILALSYMISTTNGYSFALSPNAHEQEIWKLYAHTRLLNAKQFECLDELWTRESHWNNYAKGDHSTAYGIPQILGLKDSNPYNQIDAGIKYISHRYHYACNALNHSKRYGNY